MRRTLFILFILFLLGTTKVSAGSVIVAASGSPDDLQAAVDSANIGDTVIIPEGDFDFDGTVTIPAGIYLQGAGRDITILRKTGSSVGSPMILFDGSTGAAARFSGIKLIGLGDESSVDRGLGLFNSCVDFRAWDCHFEGFGYYAVCVLGPDARGVIDNCNFIDNFRPGYGYGVLVNGSYNNDYGDKSWARPLELGTENAVFVEDCYFTGQRHCIVGHHGGRYVFRYNDIIDHRQEAAVNVHCTIPGIRGGRSWEIYENIIEAITNPYSFNGMEIQSGDGVIFNNYMIDIIYPIQLKVCNSGTCGPHPCPDQITEAYIWGNIFNGEPLTSVYVRDADQEVLQENRDYFMYERPGYTPYAYPHPLRTSSNPLNANINASPTSGEIPLTVNFTGNATGGAPPYNYNWNFGDSTSSTEQNPTHTYSQAGDYTVTLTVTDSESNQDNDSLIINASAVIAPLQVSFIASPTSGEVPLSVNFTGSATGGVLPYSYSWDFGDGTSSSEQNPSHTYSDPGDYTVTLTVTDSDSNQDSDSLIINASAPSIALEASCAASPTSGEAPLTVNFTGSATGGVLPYSYSWDFGDGTSSSEQNPSHTYSDPGDYTVYLTVTDNDSNQDTASLTINASVPVGIPLQASCAASPTSGEIPLTVNFTGSATGGTEPYTYSWDFGDSTSSSEQNPTHAYSDPGDYTITLTVADNDSNQDSDSLSINVSTPPTQLEASCAASLSSGEVPLTVNFTGSVTGGVLPYSYSWDFGDGTSSSKQNPSHIYNDAGDYTVTLTVTDSQSNQDSDSLTINVSAAIPPYLSCSPKSLYFGATTSGNETADQYLRIINAGSGTLTWNIEDDADWLSCSPSSGTDRGEITVSVNASGLSLGLYIATITVSSPEAYNSPQYVSVNFRVYEPEQESPPFGSLDTPVDGSTVSGSIPITGWALDDIEVIRLEIKRNSDPVDLPEAIGSDGLVYIGDAVFVEGARPDVEQSYPDYPLNSRAGWGYMLLTNDLPYRGNGSFTIYGFAYDAGDNREEIGRKTILCNNINRVKPFGTIDTSEQGESISGSDYINFGWALTPLPKTIPKDGSTISVWVDGVQVGHPVYDQYREDIATLYPEYNNAQGAVGYYYLDTTQYENGMHTIAWSVTDDEGEADEIGARYFFIDNIETGSAYHGPLGLRSIYREDVEGRLRIRRKKVGKEYGPRVDSDRELNAKSILNIQIEEMEPLRIVLEEGSGGNMKYIGWGENKWKALPIGSTLDREKGIFSWIPTPGFIGRYVFHFAVTDGSYMSKPLRVEVNVIPKSCERELIREIGKLPPLKLKAI